MKRDNKSAIIIIITIIITFLSLFEKETLFYLMHWKISCNVWESWWVNMIYIVNRHVQKIVAEIKIFLHKLLVD